MNKPNAQTFFHSVHLQEDKCKGCVNCIRRCPTEAIRVRDGKAHIIEARCIDCGECVRTCVNKAKIVLADSLEDLKKYSYNVALPAPAIYGQFPEGTPRRRIVGALLAIGFDHVVDVALGADLAAVKIHDALAADDYEHPAISSACPAVVRLVQVRFPNLIEHILPVMTPMRASAAIARAQVRKNTSLPDDQIGVFFISPCPGKVSAVNEPAGYKKRVVSGAIPICDVYPMLRDKVLKDPAAMDKLGEHVRIGSGLGVGWGRSGGEALEIGNPSQIAVDGIHNVITILEEVERGKLKDIAYIEAQACAGGCVGGVLTVENPFITRRRIRIRSEEEGPAQLPDESEVVPEDVLTNADWFRHDSPVEPRPSLKLDEDMAEAIRKMFQMEQILKGLPGLDCGSCGAPNCQALAEDVVRGLASEVDCVFKLRERVRQLAGEMIELAEKSPPAMGHNEKRQDEVNAAAKPGEQTGPEIVK